jgi:ATP-dependent DNA ligase
MDVLTALDEIEKAAQGNERLAMLKRCDEACPDLRSILNLALSPQITFGVKKLPEPQMRGRPNFTPDEWLHEFRDLLGDLRKRVLTGNDAQLAISAFLGACDPQARKWTERILKQDLRINIGAKDVNNALGFECIYQFNVALATDYAKVKEKDLKGLWYVEAKYDGARVVALLPEKGGRVTLLSRTGKEWGNFEALRAGLQAYNNERNGSHDVYLDGEVIALVDGKVNFQAIQKVLMAKDGRTTGDLRYVVFDAAIDEEWIDPKLTYDDRLEHARRYVEEITKFAENVVLVKHYPRTNPTILQLQEDCTSFVEQGFEGAMYRRADLPVENKRGKRLLKVKTFQDAEATITGAVEGTGRMVGMLGALQCDVTGSGKFLFEIGTGFDDAERKRLWDMRTQLPGLKVNFKFFETTNDGIPRFPVYRSLRSSDDV